MPVPFSLSPVLHAFPINTGTIKGLSTIQYVKNDFSNKKIRVQKKKTVIIIESSRKSNKNSVTKGKNKSHGQHTDNSCSIWNFSVTAFSFSLLILSFNVFSWFSSSLAR